MAKPDFETEFLNLLVKRLKQNLKGGYDLSNLGPETNALLERRIQERLREQSALYQRANVPANTRAVIDQVIEQEKEQLIELLHKWEDSESDVLSEFIYAVIDEYLPDLRQHFHNRYS